MYVRTWSYSPGTLSSSNYVDYADGMPQNATYFTKEQLKIAYVRIYVVEFR
jgi:hypothetical protein